MEILLEKIKEKARSCIVVKMNEEVEIKVKLKNPGGAIKFLDENAEFVKSKSQKDDYFVPQNNDFFGEDPTKEYLRVRFEGEKNNIGYHFCHFDDKGRLLKTDEYESKVENPEMVEEILNKIGIIKRVSVEKNRKTYKYNDYEIVVDEIKNLGWFMEIEAGEIKESIEKTKEECYNLLKKFNIDWEEAPNMGYPDMILKKD